MILDSPDNEDVVNAGWKCGLCGFKSLTMPGASDIIMAHIKNIHPHNWKYGEWNMVAIPKDANSIKS